MKYANTIFLIALSIICFSCEKESLSDQERPIPSRNAKLNVTVEHCNTTSCDPLEGKIVNIYEYEDEAMGFNEGLRIVSTDTAGVARFGFIELSTVFVTVRHEGELQMSQVSLPNNSLSHHLVTFSL